MTTIQDQQTDRQDSLRRKKKKPKESAGITFRSRNPVVVLLQQAAIITVVLISMIPLYIALVTSFAPATGFDSGNIAPPLDNGTFDNYVEAWTNLGFRNMFKNSLIFSISAALASTFVAAVTSHAFVRFRFVGRRELLALLIAAIAIPPIVIVIPLFVTMTGFGATNETYSAPLVATALLLPFSVFLLYSFMKDLPEELFDAAMVDGAGSWQQFWHISLPLSRSGLVTTGVIAAIFAWNDLLIPLIFWQTQDLETLMIGLSKLATPGRAGIRFVPLLMAAAALSIIPLIVLFALTRRALVRGLTEGIGK